MASNLTTKGFNATKGLTVTNGFTATTEHANPQRFLLLLAPLPRLNFCSRVSRASRQRRIILASNSIKWLREKIARNVLCIDFDELSRYSTFSCKFVNLLGFVRSVVPNSKMLFVFSSLEPFVKIFSPHIQHGSFRDRSEQFLTSSQS